MPLFLYLIGELLQPSVEEKVGFGLIFALDDQDAVDVDEYAVQITHLVGQSHHDGLERVRRLARAIQLEDMGRHNNFPLAHTRFTFAFDFAPPALLATKQQ